MEQNERNIFIEGGRQQGGSIMFTKREQQCLAATIQNKDTAQIAMDLGISEKSVCFYLTNAAKKLSVLSSQVLKNGQELFRK